LAINSKGGKNPPKKENIWEKWRTFSAANYNLTGLKHGRKMSPKKTVFVKNGDILSP